VKPFRLLRLLQLVRLCRSTRFFRTLEVHMLATHGTQALLRYFFMLLVIAHLLASL